MKIYNYLFYKGYQMAVMSRNFDGMPVLGATVFVVPCVMFNIFAIALTLEGLKLLDVTFDKDYKFLFSALLVLAILFYYLQGNRHQRIIKKYEAAERRHQVGLHPILVFIIYYATSTALLFMAGFFKNGDWIFSN